MLYRKLPKAQARGGRAVSVLIPAHNVETRIAEVVRSVLANNYPEFEVIVLDDQSTDGTASIVRHIASGDRRVRLLNVSMPPAGWSRKSHACHVLARHAAYDLLLFMDADVQIQPDALARMAACLERHSHMVLACGFFRRSIIAGLAYYLPFAAMLLSRWSGLVIARRDAYERAGGHATHRNSPHVGLILPRTFRKAGYRTDIFDATDLVVSLKDRSSCRNLTEGAYS